MPVASTADGAAALEELLPLLRRELRVAGAVAVHGDRRTDFVSALCAAHLHDGPRRDPLERWRRPPAAGLEVGPDACALVGVELVRLRAVALSAG